MGEIVGGLAIAIVCVAASCTVVAVFEIRQDVKHIIKLLEGGKSDGE